MGRAVAQLVKCLAFRSEDLTSDPQHPHAELGMIAHPWEMEIGRSLVCLPVGLAKTVSARLRRDPVSKSKVESS